MEGDGDYIAEEYYEGDGVLCYVHMPGVDDAPEGRLGGDRHPPARRRGLPSFCGRSLGPITGKATQSNAGALPEVVSGMVAGQLRILAGAEAMLVISVIAAAVAAEDQGDAPCASNTTMRTRWIWRWTTSDVCCIPSCPPGRLGRRAVKRPDLDARTAGPKRPPGVRSRPR